MSIKRKFKKKWSKFDSKHSKLLPTISYFNRVNIISLIEADATEARVVTSWDSQKVVKILTRQYKYNLLEVMSVSH
jgi:hypothetical protein